MAACQRGDVVRVRAGDAAGDCDGDLRAGGRADAARTGRERGAAGAHHLADADHAGDGGDLRRQRSADGHPQRQAGLHAACAGAEHEQHRADFRRAGADPADQGYGLHYDSCCRSSADLLARSLPGDLELADLRAGVRGGAGRAAAPADPASWLAARRRAPALPARSARRGCARSAGADGSARAGPGGCADQLHRQRQSHVGDDRGQPLGAGRRRGRCCFSCSA